jgi:predicted Fe-Mo cluster-binding NifX family protein
LYFAFSVYKIAIPENNGQVNQHFGQSSRFAVVDIKDREVVGVEEISAASLAHNHGGLAGLLQQADVSAVIAGGIGSEAATAAAMNRLINRIIADPPFPPWERGVYLRNLKF